MLPSFLTFSTVKQNTEVIYHWTASLLKMSHPCRDFYPHFVIVKQWVALYLEMWVPCSMFCNDTFSRNNKCASSICSLTLIPSQQTQDVNWTYIRRSGSLLNVLCTFNLRPVSTGMSNCQDAASSDEVITKHILHNFYIP